MRVGGSSGGEFQELGGGLKNLENNAGWGMKAIGCETQLSFKGKEYIPVFIFRGMSNND